MANTDTATELPPERAAELTREGGARLIDVRHPEEHDAGHIPGDEPIPFDRLRERAGDFGQGQQLVVYCRSGDRSAAAAQALRASGFDAYSITGGLVAWTEQGLPLEPEDGEVVQPRGLPPD